MAALVPALVLGIVTLGVPPCQEGVPTEWEIGYRDGIVEPYTTGGGEMYFDERPYRDWRSRSRPVGTQTWSNWSQWFLVEKYPGDINGDGVVDLSDWQILRRHLGETIPVE